MNRAAVVDRDVAVGVLRGDDEGVCRVDRNGAAGRCTRNLLAEFATTRMSPLVWLIESAASLAVIVCGPAVVNATLNEPTPAVNVLFAGRLVSAPVSVLVKWIVPPYPMATLLN